MSVTEKKERFVVNGGQRLYGKVKLHGGKNAVLPILVAATLTDECVVVEDCPNISDVENMCRLLEDLGARIEREGRSICVCGRATSASVSESLFSVMRSSMFALGSLLVNVGEVSMPYPGGCKIGARPMDIHLSALEKLGVECSFDEERIHCRVDKLIGGDVYLRYPSVGATQNALMCSVLAKGESKIVNCAREPEIVSLAHALRAMGAKIWGEGSSVIFVEGVEKLHGATITPIADRIVLATIMCAVSLCGGDVTVENSNISHLGALLDVLKNDGCKIENDLLSTRIFSNGNVKPCDIITGPYPLFATDIQPQILATKCFASGVSKVRETVFENRFAHIEQLKRFGANIDVSGQVATVCASKSMRGAEVYATDLRGGAGMMMAALKIDGESKIFNPHYIDRGYEKIEDLFSSLGAVVKRECL